MKKYVVVNENALCYRMNGTDFLGVLAVSILRGGPDPRCSILPPLLQSDTARDATIADFEMFRVYPPVDFTSDEWTREPPITC